MKYLDDVRVIVSKKKYENEGVFKGAEGVIIMSEIRKNTFEIAFTDENGKDYAMMEINVADLELVRDNGLTDEEILKDLPLHDPHWWCKVEDGFILNLLGEKKNKIPYDYNS